MIRQLGFQNLAYRHLICFVFPVRSNKWRSTLNLTHSANEGLNNMKTHG